MKKIYIALTACLLLIGAAGCKNIPIVKGDISKQEATQRDVLESLDYKLGQNNKERLNNIAALAYGTEYSLSKVNSPPEEVIVARDMNRRIVSISGSPAVEEMKRMQETIDKLTSQLKTERREGQELLAERDAQIQELQMQTKSLNLVKDSEIKKYIDMAEESAAIADEYKSKMDSMNSFFGLGAVFYGLKRFVVSAAWFIGIGSVLFLILRFASAGSPLAASVFSIFETIASWFVNAIRVAVPKAVETAGYAAKGVVDMYKNTMKKLVDGIEMLEERQKALGDPNRKFTLDELKVELAKMMDSKEKELISKTKRELGY